MRSRPQDRRPLPVLQVHAGVSGGRCRRRARARAGWLSGVPRLPPQPDLLPIVAAAEAAREDGDAAELEEMALASCRRSFRDVCGTGRAIRARRADPMSGGSAAALHRIERTRTSRCRWPISPVSAAMSRYHFLRTFRAVVGMTPHQYILHTRLHRAAVRLRRTSDSISAIAFAAGLQRSINVQSPICAHHGREPERLSCIVAPW